MKTVTAFAPATVANVAVGFDLLGFAFGVIGDEVSLTQTASRAVKIIEINGSVKGIEALPREAAKNTATVGLLKLTQEHQLDFGFEVKIRKGISLGSGMGGSAASAVAAIVAANAFLQKKLSLEEQLSYALQGEAFASGSAHADNIAPCLYGGLTLTRSIDPVDVLRVPVPKGIFAVVVHPDLQLETKVARGVLQKVVSLKGHIEQSAGLAGVLLGCCQNDLELVGRSLKDNLIEPQRQHLIPGFAQAKAAALALGALGCSISGAGPSVFAWAKSLREAQAMGEAMVAAFAKSGLKSQMWVAPISVAGARCL